MDYSTLTAAVDWSDVGTALLSVGAAIIGITVVFKGIKLVTRAVKGAESALFGSGRGAILAPFFFRGQPWRTFTTSPSSSSEL